MPAASFSDAFPVLEHSAYLNAGTCGPFPRAAAQAIAEEVDASARLGRGLAYYDRLRELSGQARASWSRLLGAPEHEIALTAGASDGMARAMSLVGWAPGDHVVVSDEEHPGALGPLGALIRRAGIEVTTAPWHDLASAVRPATKLVVVSHVSWLRGRVADLAAIGAAGAPILVDAAQSAGAIPVDLAVLRTQGVVAYAAAGQKWTCGPVGTGALWVDELWAPDHGAGVWPAYGNLADPASGLEARAWPDARRLDAPSLSCELLTGGVAALGVLEAEGWEALQTRAMDRAAALATTFSGHGLDVAERGRSTLVAWKLAGPEAAAAAVVAAAEQGVVVRAFPGEPYVRAAVGAWTSDAHIARLLQAVTA